MDTRYISNLWLLYFYPFGMPLIGRSSNAGDYRFGFGGQEKETEITNTDSHYSAEYWMYDSRLGRRWNIDPVKKQHESSYATFANNPMWFVDPLGADTFKISHNGRVVNAGASTGSDVVYSLNRKGDIVNSREYDYGTIELSSAKEGSDNFYIMKVRGDDQAKDLFEFVATPENFGLKAGQNVEWGRILTGEAGANGLNFLTTSQGLTSEKAGSYLFHNQLKYGYTIRGHDHNHPPNDPTPSGTGGTGGDIAVMKDWKIKGNVSPYVLFRIFTPGLKTKYHPYDENSSAVLQEVIITAPKIEKQK